MRSEPDAATNAGHALVLSLVGLVWSGVVVGSLLQVDVHLGTTWQPHRVLRLAGAMLVTGSAPLLAIAWLQYRHRTGRLPWSRVGSPTLLECGLYRYWRHPLCLFSGTLLAGAGLLSGSGSLLGGVLPAWILGTGGWIFWQERQLRAQFPDLYAGYRRRTALVWPRLVWWLWPCAWIIARAGFRFRVRHPERLPTEGPYVILAAHRSCLDPLWISLVVRQPVRFVVGSDWFRRPGLGWLLGRLFALHGQRHTPTLPSARTLLRTMREGWIVALFLERERSWTEELGPMEPAALRILQRVKAPIVPLRMDGTNLVWPRWRERPSTAPVRITVQPPLSFGFVDSETLMENRLVALLRPHESGLRTFGRPNAGGIGRVLYRCPACGRRWPLLRNAGTRLGCPKCAVQFVFTPEHRLTWLREERSLGELYRSIRLTRRDLPRLARSCCPLEAVSLGRREAYLDHAEAAFAEGSARRMRATWQGTLVLTTERLLFGIAESKDAWPLATVGPVTTEGRDGLRVFRISTGQLMRVSLLGRSVVYWRDLIALAVANAIGATPSRD